MIRSFNTKDKSQFNNSSRLNKEISAWYQYPGFVSIGLLLNIIKLTFFNIKPRKFS